MAIDLRLLRCALALAEHRGFVRAGKEIHVSQPVMSRSIQQLERLVGTLLFERTAAGAFPTDAGRIFLDHAREVVARAADLDREMDLLKGLDKGELHIGAGTYPSAMMVDRVVTRLVKMHPAVRMRILTDNWANLLPLLRKREMDLAIIDVTESGEDPQLNVVRLRRHQGYFVVRGRHPLLKSKAALTLHEIFEFPLVATSRLNSTVLKGFLADAPRDNPASFAGRSIPAIACESVAMMKTIAAGTDAVAILPLNTVMAEVSAGQLVVLPFVSPAMRPNFAVVRLAHRSLSPLGETFVRLLLEADAELFEFEQKTAPKLLASPKSRARLARA